MWKLRLRGRKWQKGLAGNQGSGHSRRRARGDPSAAGHRGRRPLLPGPHLWPCGPGTSAPHRDPPKGSSPARRPRRRCTMRAGPASSRRVPAPRAARGAAPATDLPAGPATPAEGSGTRRFRHLSATERPARAHNAASSGGRDLRGGATRRGGSLAV